MQPARACNSCVRATRTGADDADRSRARSSRGPPNGDLEVGRETCQHRWSLRQVGVNAGRRSDSTAGGRCDRSTRGRASDGGGLLKGAASTRRRLAVHPSQPTQGTRPLLFNVLGESAVYAHPRRSHTRRPQRLAEGFGEWSWALAAGRFSPLRPCRSMSDRTQLDRRVNIRAYKEMSAVTHGTEVCLTVGGGRDVYSVLVRFATEEDGSNYQRTKAFFCGHRDRPRVGVQSECCCVLLWRVDRRQPQECQWHLT